MPGERQRRIHLASAAGGHLYLLIRNRAAFAGHPLVWVTQPSARADALRAEGEHVELLPPHDRRVGRAAIVNLARSLWIVLRDRPRLVVTSGSGHVVPFCLLARLLGARLVFIETAARVRAPSMTGRILSRI